MFQPIDIQILVPVLLTSVVFRFCVEVVLGSLVFLSLSVSSIGVVCFWVVGFFFLGGLVRVWILWKKLWTK